MARVGASPLGEAGGPAGGVAYVRPVPGEALLHPVALGAIALLLVNDHVLKAILPGVITGKLSDFAGLVFFPLLLVGIGQVLAALLRRDAPTQFLLLAAVGITATLFVGIKVSPLANELVAAAMGSGQWLVGRSLGGSAPAPTPVSITLDPTDLIALPSLALAYWIGRGRR